MSEKRWHNRDRFMLFHQGAVLLSGVVVMAISPHGDPSFFLPFVVALSPALVALYTAPLEPGKLAEGSRPVRTYFLSSLVGILCALGLMAMWLVWAMMEALRAFGSGH